MAKLIPAAERITRARALIQEAREFSVPAESTWSHFSYVAQVKDRLQKARDLIKFISYSPSATPKSKTKSSKSTSKPTRLKKNCFTPEEFPPFISYLDAVNFDTMALGHRPQRTQKGFDLVQWDFDRH